MADKVAQPIGDRVLLKESEQQSDRTAGGIIIPDSAKLEDVKRAEVIKVGPGIYTQNGTLIPMSVKEGDEVILPPYHQGQEVKINGEKYTLLSLQEEKLDTLIAPDLKSEFITLNAEGITNIILNFLIK